MRRSISTITRELSRNSTDGKYDFITANEVAVERRGRHNNQKITSDNWTYIRSLIRQKWSPDQIDQWPMRWPNLSRLKIRNLEIQFAS